MDLTKEQIEQIARAAYWEGCYDTLNGGCQYFMDSDVGFNSSRTLEALREGRTPDPYPKQLEAIESSMKAFWLCKEDTEEKI